MNKNVDLARLPPARASVWSLGQDVTELSAGYHRLDVVAERQAIGFVNLQLSDAACLQITDWWTRVSDHVTRVSRQARVEGIGAPDAGFETAILLPLPQGTTFMDVQAFAPGIMYGHSAGIGPRAIGSRQGYADGIRAWRVREDRLPAPLVGVWSEAVGAIAILHDRPTGNTTRSDADDTNAEQNLIDERFDFASLGMVETADASGIDTLHLGAWFPGTEGEITYRGDSYPGGQMRRWRRRYHPIRDQFTCSFDLLIRTAPSEGFTDFVRSTWRWAWEQLRPTVVRQDLPTVRRACVQVLAGNVQTIGGKTGVNVYVPANEGRPHNSAQYMGFVGRSTDAAYHLLRAAADHETPRDERKRYRSSATAILDDFATLCMDPPQAEGFKDGQPHTYPFMGRVDVLYLRSLCEGARATLDAWALELQSNQGRDDHPRWHIWVDQFAGWLLRQQRRDGSIPRAYRAGTGEVVELSGQSSYVAVPFLLRLASCVGDNRHRDAAVAAGEYAWTHGQQAQGNFVGGTIDNPDVVDKEAGTLSLDAYLALYEATGESHWIDRARAAADFAETWIYAWDVPLPIDTDPTSSHWKPGCSTVGTQLISTGHSLVDQYMAFDAGNYAKLAKLTCDAHYRDVARILLQNTKVMLGLPGRTWDLAGPGWQQEHWSHAPRRGRGLHRGWLPWLAISHLHGIDAVLNTDPDLLEELTLTPVGTGDKT